MNFEHNLNLLYDYLNNMSNNLYKIDEINIDKINESDVEIPEGKESKEILSQILTKNLQYLFTIENDIYFRILSDNISSIVKISMNNKSYNDNLISYILSQLVLEKKTNNILLPIININVRLNDIKDLLYKIESSQAFITMIEKEKNPLISISIREGFHNIITLRHLINRNKNIEYNKILYQIIETLNEIKKKYSKFSHNNLNLDNIFVYELRNNKYEFKITNFEKSKILIEHENDVTDEKVENKTNDLITLSKDILKENKNLDLSTKNFLTKLIDMKNNNLENILNDNYFKIQDKKYNGSRTINSMDGGSKLKIIRNMIGGSDKPSILPMRAEKNNPFRSNDERLTASKKQDEIVKRPTDPSLVPYKHPVLMEQTIYDTTKSNKPPPYKEEMAPSHIPLYNSDGNMMGIPMSNMMYNPVYKEPMQKVYNISLANPLHNFSTVASVFEDVLPGDPRTFTFTTTFERKELINFMRNLINDDGDGESMNVTGGRNTLLSSLKLLDLNPYTLNKHPYKDLGKNFMIYRAMYPIRYDFDKHKINAAKGSHGINVRMYNIRLCELDANKINNSFTNLQFDLWRDLQYYKHIKDNILGKKVSPNFISYILYKIDNLSNINWNDLTKFQKKDKSVDKDVELNRMASLVKQNKSYSKTSFNSYLEGLPQNYSDNSIDNKLNIIFLNNNQKNQTITDLTTQLAKYNNIKVTNLDPIESLYLNLTKQFNVSIFPCIIFKYNNETIHYKGVMNSNEIIDFLDSLLVNVLQDSGKSLILLTEAPNNNIIRWASPLYENKGSLRSMIATGYHKPEVWKSVLFQIMHVLYVLQKEEIYFEELSLETNFYIKDVFYDANNLNYWIYNVNGLDYYVPNYGYLVLFDSKYSDLASGEYKIRSTKLFPNLNDKKIGNNDAVLNLDYNTLIFNQLKVIFDPFNFNNKLKKLGGLEPDSSILDLIQQISNTPLVPVVAPAVPPAPLAVPPAPLPAVPPGVAPVVPPAVPAAVGPEIKDVIRTHFAKYLNNRIGVLLTKTEKENVNMMYRPHFNIEGQLLVKRDRFDTYTWVLYENKVTPLINNTLINVINKDVNQRHVNQHVAQNSLSYYPDLITPINIESKNIIETYKNQ